MLFLVGDRVITPMGRGTVVKDLLFDPQYTIGVSLDEHSEYGHTMGGLCEEGHGWYFHKDNVKRVGPSIEFSEKEDYILDRKEIIKGIATTVSTVEMLYPETCLAFKLQQEEQYKLFCSKQCDYGPSNISLGTTLESDEDIKNSLMGLWFRMNDKMQRLKTLIFSGQSTQHEKIEDSWKDLSNYANISTIVKKRKWAK